jgi:hypothetical protein
LCFVKLVRIDPFKQLLDAMDRGFFAIGPAPFEIGFTVEVFGQKRFDGLAIFVFVGGKVFAEEVRVGHRVSLMVKNHGCKTTVNWTA